MRWVRTRVTSNNNDEDWPAHSTVDGKVDGVGEADEGVDDQDDVLRHLVVQEGVETTKNYKIGMEAESNRNYHDWQGLQILMLMLIWRTYLRGYDDDQNHMMIVWSKPIWEYEAQWWSWRGLYGMMIW